MIKLTKWLWESDISLIQKIKYELNIRKEKKRRQILNDRIFKWNFIRSAVIEYYSGEKLDVTPDMKAKQEMRERIKTVKELEFWYKRALKWRKEQWKIA